MISHAGEDTVSVGELVRDSRELKTKLDKVLVIYTGGTIGSASRDLDDPESPEVVYPWEDLKKAVRGLSDIPFHVDAISFKDPLDSANVGPRHWRTMAHIIEQYYTQYAGFVIAHGTDTMVYTASALSFILENLEKPVIITGSQIPALKKIRNDAEQNLITSLLIANHEFARIPVVPEVAVFFRDKLIRGSRCKKVDASGYRAFDSPNYPLLGFAGDRIDIHEEVVRKPDKSAGFQIQPMLNTDVIVIDIFPGFQDNTKLISDMLGNEAVKGVVLKTYGAGNIPTTPADLLGEIKKAVDRGVFVINVTQCMKGDVQQGLYDTSAVLQDAGVISGQDITPEAALCKLMNVIGNPILDHDQKRKSICQNMAGEQRYSMYDTTIDATPAKVDSAAGFGGRYRSTGVAINVALKDRIQRALIRFCGAEISGAEKLLLKLFINLPPAASPDEGKPTFAGSYKKSRDVNHEKQTFTFDIVRTVSNVLRDINTVTVYAEPTENGHGVFSWESLEMTLFAED
jgi:L-asparaginase